MLLFLSDEFEGGNTQFFVETEDSLRPARYGYQTTIVNIKTAVGAALCFPHGTHPLHFLHGSEEIISGTKYIIRSDVLYEL